MAVWEVCGFSKKTDRGPDFLFAAVHRAHFTVFFFKENSLTAEKGASKHILHLIYSPVEAIGDMNVCFILDGLLILYGVILTVLYCRLRMGPAKKTPANPAEKQPAEGGIYAGLTSHSTDTYETIKMDKKPIV